MNGLFPKLTKQGVQVKTVAEITSTNDVLAEQIGSADCVQLLVADRQTAGHGKFDRHFYSPQAGAYFSLGWPVSLLPAGWNPQKMTVTAAVASRQVCEQVSGQALTVKWVNDLYLGDHKLAGILAQTALSAQNQFSGLVVGIGINLVAPTDWPSELQERAGALFNKPLTKAARYQLIDDLCSCYLGLLKKPWSKVLAAYRAKQYLTGKKITVDSGQKKTTGRFAGIDAAGQLLLQTKNGLKTFTTGTVRLAQ